MFEGWDSYYVLIGSAGAALIGLLFVVASLTGGRERSAVMRGARLYMTPVVFHLGAVVVLSALALTPRLRAEAVGLISGACAVAGLAYATWISVGIRRGALAEPAHWSDVWWYGVGPGAIYLGLAAAAVSAWTAPRAAPYALAAAALLLLLNAIRNAWDLVTWLAPRPDAG